jgi:hypothetical protein
MVTTWLSRLAQTLVAVGALIIAAGIVWPSQVHGHVRIGFSLLVVAAMVTFTRHYLLRTPWPSRYGGGLVHERTHPVAYRISFLATIVIFSFIAWILLHDYIAL